MSKIFYHWFLLLYSFGICETDTHILLLVCWPHYDFFIRGWICTPLWIMYKYLRAGPPEMPFRNWYNCGTKHFHQTNVVWWKWRTQLAWEIKPVPHDLVRRIGFWRIKSPEQDLKYLYWTIGKKLFWNIPACKGTYMIDWVGRAYVYTCIYVCIYIYTLLCLTWFIHMYTTLQNTSTHCTTPPCNTLQHTLQHTPSQETSVAVRARRVEYYLTTCLCNITWLPNPTTPLI